MADRQRVRDPIHGLVVFDKSDQVDKIAWDLIQTPEFQRLRRIRQLGVSEFVFPSATHTRFAHSIGVFHNARRMMKIVEREEGSKFKIERAKAVLISSLLHDIGHGPFSHTFEGARERIAELRGTGQIEKHEKFSGKIIRNLDGNISNILVKYQDSNFRDEVADILEADNPIDIYHAVVSSSFDADRLDYLVRDRYMTGTGTGSIDHEWLLDNLTKHRIKINQDDDPEPQFITTFIFKTKGRQAAEDFLLARYRLYSQVYLHKTTRGFEKIISAILEIIGDKLIPIETLGLMPTDPLVIFLREDNSNIDLYLRLDDHSIWSAISHIASSSNEHAAKLSKRILNRERLTVIDVSAEYGHDLQKVENAKDILDSFVENSLNISVFKDEAPYNLYSKSGGENTKAHKVIRVKTGDGDEKEITDFNETIVAKQLTTKRNLTRYYFLDESERAAAHKAMRGG